MRSKELGDRKPVTLNLFRVISQKIGKRDIQNVEFKPLSVEVADEKVCFCVDSGTVALYYTGSGDGAQGRHEGFGLVV